MKLAQRSTSNLARIFKELCPFSLEEIESGMGLTSSPFRNDSYEN